MAAVEITFNGMFYDRATRTYYHSATMVGEAYITNLGVGGGPMPPGPGGGEKPPSIWDPVFPTPPIANVPGAPGYRPPGSGGPPGIWGPTDPRPTPPIYLPPDLPPSMQPPAPPPPGTTAPVPPPAGQAGWPVQPMQPPEYIVVNYPGVGPIYVAPPPHATPA